MSVVAFFRSENGETFPIRLCSGDVISPATVQSKAMPTFDRSVFQSMTNGELQEFLNRLGLKIAKSARKDTILDEIENKWDTILRQASDKELPVVKGTKTTDAPTSSGGYDDKVSSNVPKFKHGGLSSGYGKLSDKIDPKDNGFRTFWLQGKLHITTDFGCYMVCDTPDEEREWMMTHNFVMLGRKDCIEDGEMEGLSPHLTDPCVQRDDEQGNDAKTEDETADPDVEQVADKKEKETVEPNTEQVDDIPTWSEKDEKQLRFLIKANDNPMGIRMDSDIALGLMAKKAKAEASTLFGQGDMKNSVIYLNDEDEEAVGVLNIKFEKMSGCGCFKFHYNPRSSFNDIAKVLKETYDIDVGEALGMSIFKVKFGTSFVEMWEPIQSCVSMVGSDTATLVPSFFGGAKPVKKSEKLAVVKVKCAKMAEKVNTSTGHDLTKYTATYKTLVEDPEAISKLVNEMPLTEANAVMTLLEEKKVKENTLYLIAKHIVPSIGEAQNLKEHYGTIYDALTAGFYHAMTVAIYNDEKGKMDFSVLERMVAKKQGVEETKRDMEL